MGILLALLILTLTIAVHEYGHYLAMRRNGIPVKEFTIGFGPTLWQRQLKSGTVFKLKLIVLGGYAMPTEEGATLLETARPWVKFKVYIAGMFMNATAAFLVMVAFGYITGLVPVAAMPYVKTLPKLLIPLAVAFGLSYGMWLATPPLIVWMLVKSATAFFATAAGPIGIVNIGHQMAAHAPNAAAVAVSMILLFALINSAIAGFNLVPLAQLDGGKIFEMLLEKVFGRYAPGILKWYRIVSLVLILGLAIWLISADIFKLVTGAVLIPKG